MEERRELKAGFFVFLCRKALGRSGWVGENENENENETRRRLRIK